jgi:hypothetical protein
VTDLSKITGFDWDEGNARKNEKDAVAYFGDRDRSFRRIVTVAQRVVSRGRIVIQSVTMGRNFPAF